MLLLTYIYTYTGSCNHIFALLTYGCIKTVNIIYLCAYLANNYRIYLLIKYLQLKIQTGAYKTYSSLFSSQIKWSNVSKDRLMCLHSNLSVNFLTQFFPIIAKMLVPLPIIKQSTVGDLGCYAIVHYVLQCPWYIYQIIRRLYRISISNKIILSQKLTWDWLTNL